MPSEIRVDALKNTSGLGTITYNNTSTVFSGTISGLSSITASGPITLNTTPFFRNSTGISTDYVITTSYNEMSIGPVTINSGVTVTVNTGAIWTVV